MVPPTPSRAPAPPSGEGDEEELDPEALDAEALDAQPLEDEAFEGDYVEDVELEEPPEGEVEEVREPSQETSRALAEALEQAGGTNGAPETPEGEPSPR